MNVDPGLVLVLGSNTMADAEPDLGERLLRSFLQVLGTTARIPGRILCLGTGVFLTTEGSPVSAELRVLVDAGARLFSCATCLDYYGRRDQLILGEVGTMKDTVEAMLDADKLLRP